MTIDPLAVLKSLDEFVATLSIPRSDHRQIENGIKQVAEQVEAVSREYVALQHEVETLRAEKTSRESVNEAIGDQEA